MYLFVLFLTKPTGITDGTCQAKIYIQYIVQYIYDLCLQHFDGNISIIYEY